MQADWLGPAAPRSPGRFTRALGRRLLRLWGWRIEGGPLDQPRCVMVVAPHTSNWDFIHGLCAKWALGLSVRFLAKHTLFRFPFSAFLRAIGGIPVDRRATNGLVERVASLFVPDAPLYLVVTPEGTRRRVPTWRTGFHRIAVAAGVPILPVAFDYPARTVRLLRYYTPTGDYAADLRALSEHFTPLMARHPESYAVPVAASAAAATLRHSSISTPP
jgi:1-acyl-sn-glycerol-3-phosphate acyltransferase